MTAKSLNMQSHWTAVLVTVHNSAYLDPLVTADYVPSDYIIMAKGHHNNSYPLLLGYEMSYNYYDEEHY